MFKVCILYFPKVFHLMLLPASTPLQPKWKYCTFYSTTLILMDLVILWIQIITVKHESTNT